MTLIKTFPSWDPEACRAAAAAADAPVSSGLPANPSARTLHDSTDRLNFTTDKAGKIVDGTIETFQELPDSFFRELADKKTYQNGLFAPDEIQVASIPAGLFDQWYREGFDIVGDKNITPEMIVAKLRATSMEKFITCDKIG